MKNFFNKIDQTIINLFQLLKDNFTFQIPNCIFDTIKSIFKKIDTILMSSPNFHKLIKDFIEFFQSNKKMIWYLFRIYIYICVLMYIITWALLMIAILSNNSILLFIAKLFLQIYIIWTKPIKKQKFLIKYLFYIPYKIISVFVNILKNISIIIKKHFNTKNECSPKEEPTEDNPKSKFDNDYDPDKIPLKFKKYIDPVTHEQLCLKYNSWWYMWKPYRAYKSFYNSAEVISTSMDQENPIESIKIINKCADNLKEEWNESKEEFICLNPHQLRIHNNHWTNNSPKKIEEPKIL